MTVSSALAPFNLPHDGRCVCAECPWGEWCNYCIMKMEPRAHELILVNRKRPSAPIFLSFDEATRTAEGLAHLLAAPGKKFNTNSFHPALVRCIQDFAVAWPEDYQDEPMERA